MSITSEINRIKGNIADAYTAADGKGATLPVTQNSANLASCISSITGGGSSPVIQSLSITPATSAQEHTAPTGVDGFSPVTVSAVTASIDNNITAGNIKKDVTILGVTGTYEGSGQADTEIVSATNETSALISTGDKVFIENIETYTRDFTSATTGFNDTTGILTIPNVSTGFSKNVTLTTFNTASFFVKVDLSSVTTSGSIYLSMPQYAWPNATVYRHIDPCFEIEISSDLQSYTAKYGYISDTADAWYGNIGTLNISQFPVICFLIVLENNGFTPTIKYYYSLNGSAFPLAYTASDILLDRIKNVSFSSSSSDCEGLQIILKDCYVKLDDQTFWTPYITTQETTIVDYSNITSAAVTGIAQEDIAVNNSGNVKILKQS